MHRQPRMSKMELIQGRENSFRLNQKLVFEHVLQFGDEDYEMKNKSLFFQGIP